MDTNHYTASTHVQPKSYTIDLFLLLPTPTRAGIIINSNNTAPPTTLVAVIVIVVVVVVVVTPGVTKTTADKPDVATSTTHNNTTNTHIIGTTTIHHTTTGWSNNQHTTRYGPYTHKESPSTVYVSWLQSHTEQYSRCGPSNVLASHW